MSVTENIAHARAQLESRAATTATPLRMTNGGEPCAAAQMTNGGEPCAASPKNAPFVPLSLADSAQRKKCPIISGFLDYFPDATAAVSYVSYMGNQKHNPGEPLHWARGKSDDHVDCIGRHLLGRDGDDPDGIDEMAEAAWRIMAALQLKIENKFGLPPSRGSTK